MTTIMTFRAPDKPKNSLSRDDLTTFEQLAPGQFFATLKIDGWSTIVEVGGKSSPPAFAGVYHSTFVSRQMTAIPISDELRDSFDEAMARFRVPGGTLFHAEWCGRRPAVREEQLCLLDVMRVGNQDLWATGAWERFTRLLELLSNAPPIGVSVRTDPEEWIVPHCVSNFAQFFDAYQSHSAAEGIVLKRCDSVHIGHRGKSSLNPNWYRCKWRSGESGLTPIA